MHKICEGQNEKAHNANGDIHLALLQIRSTPVGLGHPSCPVCYCSQAHHRSDARNKQNACQL